MTYSNNMPFTSLVTSMLNLCLLVAFLICFKVRKPGCRAILHLHEEGFYTVKNILVYLKKFFRVIVDFRGINGLPKTKKNELLISRYCSAVICASENIYQQAMKMAFRKIVYHIPVIFTRPERLNERKKKRVIDQFDIKAKKPYICFIGNIHLAKGVMVLINSFEKETSKRYSELRLLFFGKNAMGREFSDKIAGNDRIEWMGPVPKDVVPILIEESEMVSLPSFQEGLPRICLEAIALGKKFLGPGFVPELKRSCPDFVFDDLTVESIAKCHHRILKSSCSPKYDFKIHRPERISEMMKVLYTEIQEK
nr:glycosyltransferase family 4 protein [uncultured Desulfobacter sp.]